VETEHDGILLAAPRAADTAIIASAVENLADAACSGDVERVMTLIGNLVPEYRPETPNQ
jgi:O-antigen biosynthesis protein WbqV